MFLNDLQQFDFVIEPYLIDGKSMIEYQDKILSFYYFVDGKMWHELEHTDAIIYQAGENLARIHLQSEKEDSKYQRKTFENHPDLSLYLNHYKNDPAFLNSYHDTLSEIHSVPKNPTTYGLNHGDYLYSNIIYNKALTIIDFDDIEYGYYLYDIAVYMFYYLLGGDPLNMDIKTNQKRFDVFMKGYTSVKAIKLDRLEDLNPFFRLRQLKLLGTIQTYLKGNLGPWQKKYIQMTETMIKDQKPFIE